MQILLGGLDSADFTPLPSPLLHCLVNSFSPPPPPPPPQPAAFSAAPSCHQLLSSTEEYFLPHFIPSAFTPDILSFCSLCEATGMWEWIYRPPNPPLHVSPLTWRAVGAACPWWTRLQVRELGSCRDAALSHHLRPACAGLVCEGSGG